MIDPNASDWLTHRSLMSLTPGTINLNSGTLSPTPIPVLKACTELREKQAANPSDFLWRLTGLLIARARAALASYLRCDGRDLLLLPNVTVSLNTAITSLAGSLPAGSEILMSDHEYGAIVNCWKRVAARCGWTLRTVTIPYQSEDPDEITSVFSAAVGSSTRALFFSHVAYTTGLVMPARQLCKLAREKSLVSVVDGAHAPGSVPVDLGSINADYYGANCHKWMMCPANCGFLHVARDRHASTEPLVVSWGWGFKPEEADNENPEAGGSKWQAAFEYSGVTDRTPIMAIPDALDFRQTLGGDESIFARVRFLSEHAELLMSESGFKVATPRNPALRGALTAFALPACEPLTMRNWMWEKHRIECPTTRVGEKFFLRVSCAWFNTLEELAAVARAIKDAPFS